ncbi:MAG: hypothetical protein NVV72_01155 [Asticcacaulis sp.]|nr:hypothetical protein [Asticcacaulis sp.]
MKTPSAHIMEGVDRFDKPPPEDTLFVAGADIAAQNALHHSLEFFPTPPWAVRAMWETLVTSGVVDFRTFDGKEPNRHPTVWEPAAGRGHIALTLRELGCFVHASDIHDHGCGFRVVDFLAEDLMLWPCDAMVTNPPFKLAEAFVNKALQFADHVIVLCRLSFLNSTGRYGLHFDNPGGNLKTFLPCIERVPMVLGRYDPQASTATEFAWFHYQRGYRGHPLVLPIPPGSRERFQRREDVRI